MSVKARALIIGLATYIPGIRRLCARKTGGTVSARYCYSVWLRHLFMLHRRAQRTGFGTMVELGPDDSLGTGIAAALSGVERYIALDAVPYISNKRNLRLLDELIALFRERAPVPDDREFPLIRPLLPSYTFPHHILTSACLEAALAPARLTAIRSAVANPAPNPRQFSHVSYVAPWHPDAIEDGTVDLILSQTVLEFPPDLPALYAAMCRWLKPGGVMGHEIDFKSIGATVQWNGHWACSDFLWRLVAGRRRHRINREPHSTHIAILRKAGCRIVCDQRTVQPSGITRAQLAPRFRDLTDEDLTTSSALIHAVAPA